MAVVARTLLNRMSSTCYLYILNLVHCSGVTRQRILADVNRLRCPLPDKPSPKPPNVNKYEMFFLAKYLLKSRLCTIEIKVSSKKIYPYRSIGKVVINFGHFSLSV